MSQYTYDDSVDNSNKEEVQHVRTTEDTFQSFEEPIHEDLAKRLIGSDVLEGSHNFRLVTTIDGMSIVCDTSDNEEKVYRLDPENEDISTIPRDASMNYTKYRAEKDYKSIIVTVLTAITVITVIGLIYILTWRI